MATIRRQIIVQRSAADVWRVLGDPATIADWFPGIESCTVEATDEGLVRTVTLGSGMQLAESIITNDPIAHRFQYRISGGFFREHLGTMDAIDLDDGTSMVIYGTDASPDVMALVLGGATGDALAGLKDLVEALPDEALPDEALQEPATTNALGGHP